MPPRKISENETCKQMIDPQLKWAGESGRQVEGLFQSLLHEAFHS